MDWQLSGLIVYEFHWKRLINKDECDGRTCMFIVCLTSTHLNLETIFKRRILVLRTSSSSHLQLRFRYLGKFWCGIAVFSLYHVRYCGIRTSLTAPSFYEKIFWIEVWRNFFHTLLIVTLVIECLLSISFAVLLVIKVHFFEEQVVGLYVLQKDHDLFLPFLHTMSAIDDMKYEYVFMLFVCFSFIF